MRRKVKLDEKDMKIISLIQRNPDISQKEIAERVGLSQPSISARLRKLKEIGAVTPSVGMDISKMGFYLTKVDLTAKNALELVDKLSECPYFVNAYVTSGKNNLCIFLMGEDLSTLESIAEHHLRSSPDITDVNFSIIIASRGRNILPIKFLVERREKAPCGLNCSECPYYASNRCLGCPITGHYRGSFWRMK